MRVRSHALNPLLTTRPRRFYYCIFLDIAVTDYIFVIDPPDRVSSVVGLLKPHQTSDLDPGIPRKGISGSDHVSLAAELQWQNVP